MNTKIVGKLKDGERLLGTCFLINSEYAISAHHNIEKLDSYESLILEFNNIGEVHKSKRVYQERELDIIIVQLEKPISAKIDYIPVYDTLPIEQEERWESFGYPEQYNLNKIEHEYLNGEVNSLIEGNIYDVELRIYDQKDETEWSGISGAPLVIEGKIVGVIIKENISMLKNRLKAISVQKIIAYLYEKDREELLSILSFKSDNMLTKRCNEFKEECEDKFHMYSSENLYKSNYFILKPTYETDDLMEIINLFLTDYAHNLQDLIKPKFEDLRSERRYQKNIETSTQELKKILIENEKIILVLLWLILEGTFESPRIASMISLINENIKRNVYVDIKDKSIKLLIGYADANSDIIATVTSLIDEIHNELNTEISPTDLFIWDELAVNYLDINTRKKLHEFRYGSLEEKIPLEIVVLNSYDSNIYSNAGYKFINQNTKLIEIACDKETEKFQSDIYNLSSKYNWIDFKDINWIMVPVKTIQGFKTAL